MARSDIAKIVVVCEAGMGSSLMVAAVLRKRLDRYGVEVVHTPIADLPDDVQWVVCQDEIADRVRAAARSGSVGAVPVLVFTEPLKDPVFDTLEKAIRDGGPLPS